MTYRCGYVSLVGKPNVGKSTILNSILQQKITPVSPRPQTTRRVIKGIVTDEDKQIVFLDTPGLVEPRYLLHEKMRSYITEALNESDVIVFITDAPKFATDYDNNLLQILRQVKQPRLAVLNMTDLSTPAELAPKLARLQSEGFEQVVALSAINGEAVSLPDLVTPYLPYHPPMFEDDNVSDLPMRFFAAEIIREKIFLFCREEIPYSSTVTVEKWTETADGAEINATIWLERASQKPILLGEGGRMIKQIRVEAQKEIKGLTGSKPQLFLWVKVKKNWRKSDNALREFGY